MIVYAESSAVVAWILGETSADAIRSALGSAERVVTSGLTVLECERALVRAESERRLTTTMAERARQALKAAIPAWVIMEMAGPYLNRVGKPFPAEPVRTLDAIHLAAALEFHEALQTITVVSLDDRVRVNAAAMGFAVLPA